MARERACSVEGTGPEGGGTPTEHLPFRPRPIAVDDFAADRRNGLPERGARALAVE
jgi:hypothetical protein